MRHYYFRTFVGLGVLLAALAAAALLANAAAADARQRYARLANADQQGTAARAVEREKVVELELAMAAARRFSSEWNGVARLPERDAAERIRSDIEAVAQRQLGLVTDNAITPQPERFLFQGQAVRVQRVSLRASGKDLTALLTWLGNVEEKYPAAIVEGCELSSNIGGNTGLSVRLVQPLVESERHRGAGFALRRETALLPEVIASVPWERYGPSHVKRAEAVGFPRNPLQPAIAADQHPLALLHDENDSLTPRLEASLDGRVRSVVRNPSPLVVIDSRVFRVGDEVFIGISRERPMPNAKTKLKQIADDRLVFQVSGGMGEKLVQCDVVYALPVFLHAR